MLDHAQKCVRDSEHSTKQPYHIDGRTGVHALTVTVMSACAMHGHRELLGRRLEVGMMPAHVTVNAMTA